MTTPMIGGAPPALVAYGPNVQSPIQSGAIDLRDLPPIMLAVPTVQWTWTDCAAAIARLQAHLPPGSVVHNTGQGFSQIAAARNMIVSQFLKLAPSHGLAAILWVDSDMLPRADTAARLLSVATEHQASLLSALCFQRIQPFRHTVNFLPETITPLNGVQEVRETGFGCVLTHRGVFETLPYPWFEGQHEDVDFYRKARAAGFPCFVDFDFDCGHMATVSITREIADAWHATITGKAQPTTFTPFDQTGVSDEEESGAPNSSVL